ncbi:hypothetical protein LTR64_000334 [Lithohypha guttulata]|uniref:uncharacterized protein n=1 Tax=Lithohypha guttulata TaxID=1690604 RepID=UPI002DE00566|nr:hypothetical protein LTR51_005896 [Lithohypha guttulata]
MVFAEGYTMVMKFTLDGLGWTYVGIATFWTIVLLTGIAFLVPKRNLPFLRIRNVPLAVSAVATLHVYWVLCMLAYVLQGFFPCGTEYWIMSIYLPLGIALFQACNTQLLYIANLQQRYVSDYQAEKKEPNTKNPRGWRRYLAHHYVENRVKRTMIYIGYGMCIQLVVALTFFLVSRKFHSSYGLIGNGGEQCEDLVSTDEINIVANQLKQDPCEAAKKISCRRGWKWWEKHNVLIECLTYDFRMPSIIWQFFWSWCYAPYLLWQVRDIHDVHGWRKQTTYCCLAGLFATPMWLCALYIPDMLVVNKYFVPPLWFAPSIFLIEAFLVFVPCWQVVKNHRLQTETLDIIAEWESKHNGNSIGQETMQSNSRISKQLTSTSSAGSKRGDMYTMTAMESALRTNPQRLLVFAALKDFSGENISFLIQILDWKRSWSPSSPTRSGFLRRPSVHEINNKDIRRQQFKRAVDIYASYVSLKYSDYPVNLSHAHLKELEVIFEGAAMILYGHKLDDSDTNSAATPFDNFTSKLWLSHNSNSSREDIEASPSKHDGISVMSHKTHHTNGTNLSTDVILQTTEYDLNKRHTVLQAYEMTNTAPEQLPDFVPIPDGFGPDVFDRAEDSIKYMVLTNTWPKFVNAGYASTAMNKRKSFFQRVLGQYGRSNNHEGLRDG